LRKEYTNLFLPLKIQITLRVAKAILAEYSLRDEPKEKVPRVSINCASTSRHYF